LSRDLLGIVSHVDRVINVLVFANEGLILLDIPAVVLSKRPVFDLVGRLIMRSS